MCVCDMKLEMIDKSFHRKLYLVLFASLVALEQTERLLPWGCGHVLVGSVYADAHMLCFPMI